MGTGSSKGGVSSRQSRKNRVPSLPDLTGTGSERQVNWANNIRQDAIKYFDELESRLDEYASRWRSSVMRTENVSKRTAERMTMEIAERDLGYSKKDVETARSELVKAMNDQRAASAKFIIEKRDVFSPRFIERTVKTYANRRRRKK